LRDVVDVVVEVGGWEHDCCGEAIERNQLVDLSCIRYTGEGGQVRLIESHHGGLDVRAGERVRGAGHRDPGDAGRGAAQPILRVPSGQALRGFGENDDGHLEDPWTGDVIASDSNEFLVTVRTAG
jgi:hypothetical protein